MSIYPAIDITINIHNAVKRNSIVFVLHLRNLQTISAVKTFALKLKKKDLSCHFSFEHTNLVASTGNPGFSRVGFSRILLIRGFFKESNPGFFL